MTAYLYLTTRQDYLVGKWSDSFMSEDKFSIFNEIVMILLICILIKLLINYFVFGQSLHISKEYHSKAAEKLANASVNKFFDLNSESSILNIFSKDMGKIDIALGFFLLNTIGCC